MLGKQLDSMSLKALSDINDSMILQLYIYSCIYIKADHFTPMIKWRCGRCRELVKP